MKKLTLKQILIREAGTKTAVSVKVNETTEIFNRLQKSLEEARSIARELMEHANSSANELSGAMMSKYERNPEATREYENIKADTKGSVIFSINEILSRPIQHISKSLDRLKSL